MYFKCEDSDKDTVKKEDPYDPQVCNMKDSDLWTQVCGNLNIRYKNLWEYPLKKLDVFMETEFYHLRKRIIEEEELLTESE